MATKKYLSYDRLQEYHELNEAYIDAGDAAVKSYVDTELAKKSDSSHTHDGRYYTETEIDGKLSTINTSISNITSGTTPVKEATHATSADSATSATDASKLGGQLPSYYAKATDIPTGSLANKSVVSESDLDNALAEKVNAAAQGNHSHSNKTVLDGITSTKVSAWDSAEENAKNYADSAATTAANKVKNDLLNGAGTAYDTLKELGDLIDDNVEAIDALEAIASGKADATHGHAISDVSGLQSALDGKASSSHGTHVSFDSTNKPKMDGTAAFGTSSKVARADHVHPTDTSRASKSEFDAHVATHAPSNAQANVIESVKVNGTALTPSSKTVDITVPTTAADIGAAPSSHTHTVAQISDLTATATELNYMDGVTSGVQAQLDGKAASGHGHDAATTSASGFMTAAMVTKLNGIATGANKTTIDSALSSSSTNPVQNKVVNSAIVTATNAITANTNSISTHTSQISALQTAVAEIQEITSEEIQALFA